MIYEACSVDIKSLIPWENLKIFNAKRQRFLARRNTTSINRWLSPVHRIQNSQDPHVQNSSQWHDSSAREHVRKWQRSGRCTSCRHDNGRIPASVECDLFREIIRHAGRWWRRLIVKFPPFQPGPFAYRLLITAVGGSLKTVCLHIHMDVPTKAHAVQVWFLQGRSCVVNVVPANG